MQAQSCHCGGLHGAIVLDWEEPDVSTRYIRTSVQERTSMHVGDLVYNVLALERETCLLVKN